MSYEKEIDFTDIVDGLTATINYDFTGDELRLDNYFTMFFNINVQIQDDSLIKIIETYIETFLKNEYSDNYLLYHADKYESYWEMQMDYEKEKE